MAKNPDPEVKLTTVAGVTRTLDDWTTVFHLAVVVLPPRLEARAWVPVIDRIYAVLGDSDLRTTVYVPGEATIARRILGDDVDRWLTFADPAGELVSSLGLERLPAIVHLRQDTTLAAIAEGWDPDAWQEVVDEMARAHHWTHPLIAHHPGDPPPFEGWPVE